MGSWSRRCQRCCPSGSCPLASWAMSMSDWVNEHTCPYCMCVYVYSNYKSNVLCPCHRKLQETEFEREALQTHRSSGNIQILWDQKSLLYILPTGKSSLRCCDVQGSSNEFYWFLCLFLSALLFCTQCPVPGSAPFLPGFGQSDDCGDVTDRVGLSLLLLEDDWTAHAHVPHHPQHAG